MFFRASLLGTVSSDHTTLPWGMLRSAGGNDILQIWKVSKTEYRQRRRCKYGSKHARGLGFVGRRFYVDTCALRLYLIQKHYLPRPARPQHIPIITVR